MNYKDDINISPTLLYCIQEKLLIMIGGIFLIMAFENGLLKVLGLLLMAYYLVHLIYNLNIRYTVTDELIILKTGIITTKINTIELFRIKDFQLHQNVINRLLGLMVITVVSSDKSHPVIDIKGVKYDIEILHEIRRRVQKARKVNGIFEVN